MSEFFLSPASNKGFSFESLRGADSGIDLRGTLKKLIELERRPLIELSHRRADVDKKIDAYGVIRTALEDIQKTAETLSSRTAFQARKSTSSDPAVIQAETEASAAIGTHSIDVKQLAASQRLVTAAGVGNDKEKIGASAAAITITLGKTDGSVFTAASSGTPITLDLDRDNVTLRGVRDAINQSNSGISASIVNDGDKTHLVLNSPAGEQHSMKIDVHGNDALRGVIAYDGAGSGGMRQTRQARDAAFTVDGIAVRSPSNTVTTALEGVKLTLSKEGSGTLSIGRDDAVAMQAIQNLIKTTNTLVVGIDGATGYDASDPNNVKQGLLFSESIARTLRTRLGRLAAEPVDVGDQRLSLSLVGISVKENGTLEIDDRKLAALLAGQPDKVEGFFAGTGDKSRSLAGRLSALAAPFIAENGVLDAVSGNLERTGKQLQRHDEIGNLRFQAAEKRLQAEFIALESALRSMDRQKATLTEQFDALLGRRA